MSIHIQTYPLGSLQTNCHLITSEGSCVIIDPADSADFLLEEVQRKNLTLVALLATHGHFDHILAAGEIQLSFPVPLFIHKKDEFLVKRLHTTARYYLGYEPTAPVPTIIKELHPGTLDVGPFTFEVTHVPGHTPGGCSFYLAADQALFTGDTLFREAIGEYSHAYSDVKELRRSVSKLLAYPEETIIYPGHGELTSVGSEKDFYKG
jgi:hydroxyacylglutathione hydrolase